jgi:hypothetical protein
LALNTNATKVRTTNCRSLNFSNINI